MKWKTQSVDIGVRCNHSTPYGVLTVLLYPPILFSISYCCFDVLRCTVRWDWMAAVTRSSTRCTWLSWLMTKCRRCSRKSRVFWWEFDVLTPLNRTEYSHNCRSIGRRYKYLCLIKLSLLLNTLVTMTLVSDIEKCNKKLSYCWETVRRESMPRIAEINV